MSNEIGDRPNTLSANLEAPSFNIPAPKEDIASAMKAEKPKTAPQTTLTDLWNGRLANWTPSEPPAFNFANRTETDILADRVDYLTGADLIAELEEKGTIKFEGQNVQKIKESIISDLDGSQFFRQAFQDAIRNGQEFLVSTDPSKKQEGATACADYPNGERQTLWFSEDLVSDDPKLVNNADLSRFDGQNQKDYRDVVVAHEFSHALMSTKDGDGKTPDENQLFEAIVAEETGLEHNNMPLYKQTGMDAHDTHLNIDYKKFKAELGKEKTYTEILYDSQVPTTKK